MTKFDWNPEADALLTWVAGGVLCHEKRARKGKHMIDHVYLFERVADFLDALNESQPFEKSRKILNAQTVDRRAKKLPWEKLQWVKRPSCLSEEILKGQFGEVGLKDLHESTLNLRCALGNNTREWYEKIRKREEIFQRQEWYAAQNEEFLRQEEKAVQRPEKAQKKRLREEEEETDQRERFRREEEEKRREQRPRRGVEKIGYTKDTEYSGGLSWTDPNASGSHYPGPEFNSHGGAFRYGAKNVYFTTPLFPSIDHNFDGSKTGSRNER
ncbi:hypothetical protein BGAL_0278g00020 [Botrytis galanthina]|uniref:Uncharacterized protein n=1 Tax=Botrytis galanthina TaxID=278940 RepID=A0A4V4HU40_9HELO|nr:hypothetical protein BGAL_0278g00020 [Botrytis galanthina]